VELANGDVPVGVDDTGVYAGLAGYDLPLLLERLDFGPLKHGLDDGAETSFIARVPKVADVLLQRLVLLDVRRK
jgi:hypothetical protein